MKKTPISDVFSIIENRYFPTANQTQAIESQKEDAIYQQKCDEIGIEKATIWYMSNEDFAFSRSGLERRRFKWQTLSDESSFVALRIAFILGVASEDEVREIIDKFLEKQDLLCKFIKSNL